MTENNSQYCSACGYRPNDEVDEAGNLLVIDLETGNLLQSVHNEDAFCHIEYANDYVAVASSKCNASTDK